MSDNADSDSRSRINRYKEERRKHLNSQIQTRLQNNRDASNVSTETPRTTRTSRLRMAQGSLHSPSTSCNKLPIGNEKAGHSSYIGESEKDKSDQRKSNLNRNINPDFAQENNIITRKGRRALSPKSAVKLLSPKLVETKPHANDDFSPTSSGVAKVERRKSELRIHMENARKSVNASKTENKTLAKEKHPHKSSKNLSEVKSMSSNKENETGKNKQKNSSNVKIIHNLTELTKQTLMKVEKLTSKNVPSTSRANAPVSILKRKIFHDNKTESHNSPVTFSPSVRDPVSTNQKSGILKKRRSLDESLVMRHRSYSPEIINPDSKSILKNQRRSSMEELTRVQSPEIQGILKRRSSRPEEEDNSLNSPQGILKKRSGASSAGSLANTPHVSITTAVILAAARGAEMVLDHSDAMRPILKKKSFSEEQPPAQNVSYSDELDPVKPILKKKSFSDDQSYSDCQLDDTPKPILKKKSSIDIDDFDDKPKKPILKSSRGESLDRDDHNGLQKSYALSESEFEVRPILKISSRDNSPRLRLSFCEDGLASSEKDRNHNRSLSLGSQDHSDNNEVAPVVRERTVSVSELVNNYERSNSKNTGTIPKRNSTNRNSERYKTQPVTYNEYEASLLYVSISPIDDLPQQYISSPMNKNATSSLNDITNKNSSIVFLSSSLDSNSCAKMSSDSAFQSLGDGLEIEEDDCSSLKRTNCRVKIPLNESNKEAKHITSFIHEKTKKDIRFSTQPVTLEEVQEAAKLVTLSSNQSDEFLKDPSRLSLAERIKIFNSQAIKSMKKRELRTIRSSHPISMDEVQIFHAFSPASYALATDVCKEKKSILKTPSETFSTEKKITSFDHVSSSPKEHLTFADATCDEGISINDSGSDLENLSGVSLSPQHKLKPRKSSLRKSASARYSRSSLKSCSNTSDGESSSAKGVTSIMKGHLQDIRLASEGSVPKGGSQQNVHPNGKVCRSVTHSGVMPRMIAELQATLQKKGESEWRKRHNSVNVDDELKSLKDKNKYNDELSEKKTILASRKDDLDAASHQWKCRVEKSNAEKFSVAGKIENETNSIPIQIPTFEAMKKVPQAKRFKCREKDSISTPTSPEKNGSTDLKRSQTVHDPNFHSLSDLSTKLSKTVQVFQTNDVTFKSFYQNAETHEGLDSFDINLKDFDAITRESLLVQKKNIRVQKRRHGSKNPIKTLAKREDIKTEYTEILTGVAEREIKRLHLEKLAKTQKSFAIEALAGLASKENFKSVALKKGNGPTSLLPFKDLMLLHVKGRRHVQTRLVKPTVKSLNEGDCFILVTPTAVYNFIGTHSNVIEQNKALDIANHIQHTCDLGAKVDKIITINSKSSMSSKEEKAFWKLLGSNENEKCFGPGNPGEDEIFESNIISTNMIYRVENDELVPLEKYWGKAPKYEMLTATNVYVFDYGSELYVWSGKNANMEEKKMALKLSKDLWMEGYNYSDCYICPLTITEMLGNRKPKELSIKSDKRPDWSLFCKISQHRETVLFKEKFLNWPDFSKIIKIKKNEINEKSASYDIRPIDANEMLNTEPSKVDFLVEGNHLGRGDAYFDKETSRCFEFTSFDIKIWRIEENTYEELKEEFFGEFYDAESYIIRWKFKMTVKGRELTGKPSKHAQAGRDMTVYFYWQGINSSINEKGYAALFTMELDNESAPQIRVTQGSEPAAFLRLFMGKMIVYSGKRTLKDIRLFILRGDMENESFLIEVPLSSQSLRSRSSFVFFSHNQKKAILWHGCKSNHHNKKLAQSIVNKLINDRWKSYTLEEMDEKINDNSLLKLLDEKKLTRQYYSLIDDTKTYNFTPRVYYFSSVSGSFRYSELLSLHRCEHSCSFPILQNDIYSANQPALFLIDNEHELWLWQGWWPDREEEEIELNEQMGSRLQRWQAERRAAMQTSLDYWKNKKNVQNIEPKSPIYLVWAGLEPLEFTNLFPFWTDRQDIATLNLKDGRKMGEKKFLDEELALLSRSEFPLDELMKRPLPEGVDPTLLEKYLSPEDFQRVLSMTKEEFDKLPIWKQTALKKTKGLF